MRAYASAFLAATIAALVVDAGLQLALDAVRVATVDRGAPWWITAHLVERGRWVVLALLLWWGAPRLAGSEVGNAVPPIDAAPNQAWRLAGIATIAVPLLWTLATWVVSALRFTLLGSWDSDGRVFASADYYRGLLLDLGPWMMAGAAVLAVRRHLD